MIAGQPPVSAGPVIVLTYGFAGGAHLQRMLSSHSELACTAGTGVLPACDRAADAWLQADGRPGNTLSQAALSSVRSLANGLIISILARTGKRRWCEIAAAEPSAAKTFLELFPSTRFVCLHRSCPDVLYATLSSSPWGLAGPQYARFTTTHPASTVAALAAWWAWHASALLAFEREQADACLRVRYEDLAEDPDRTDRDVAKFLGLAAEDTDLPQPPGAPVRVPAEGADAPGCGAGIPVGQIPAALLAQVNQLHHGLGYPSLDAEWKTDSDAFT